MMIETSRLILHEMNTGDSDIMQHYPYSFPGGEILDF